MREDIQGRRLKSGEQTKTGEHSRAGGRSRQKSIKAGTQKKNTVTKKVLQESFSELVYHYVTAKEQQQTGRDWRG